MRNEVTALKNLETYGLKVLTVKVQCPDCGHEWGIKMESYIKSAHLPEQWWFKCTKCGHFKPDETMKTGGVELQLSVA